MCDICGFDALEYSIVYNDFTKTYIFCSFCKTIFINGMVKYLNKEIEDRKIELKHPYKITGCIKILAETEEFKDMTTFHKYIYKICDLIYHKVENKVKYYIPYANCVILNADGSFYSHTSKKKMQKFIDQGRYIKYDDNTIQFKEYQKQGFPDVLQCKEIKENKCIKCGNPNYLKKINILPFNVKKKFINVYTNILCLHFYYATCIDCLKDCEEIRKKCDKYYVDVYGTDCLDVLKKHVETKDDGKILEFIIGYKKVFNDMLE